MAVVLVGERKDSAVCNSGNPVTLVPLMHVRMKRRKCGELGIETAPHSAALPELATPFLVCVD